MKVFFDTNVLIAAFITHGLCADLLRLVLAEHTLVTGQFVLNELKRILSAKFKMPAEKINEIIGFLEEQTIIPIPHKRAPEPARDPDDQWVLASALKGQCPILVTGDKDLLDLKKFEKTILLTPREAWEKFKSD